MSSIKKLSHWDLINMYDDVLNDVYGDVNVAGYTYASSELLKRVDSIAYDEGFNNYCDSLECDECGGSVYSCECCDECGVLHDEDEVECLNDVEVK